MSSNTATAPSHLGSPLYTHRTAHPPKPTHMCESTQNPEMERHALQAAGLPLVPGSKIPEWSGQADGSTERNAPKSECNAMGWESTLITATGQCRHTVFILLWPVSPISLSSCAAFPMCARAHGRDRSPRAVALAPAWPLRLASRIRAPRRNGAVASPARRPRSTVAVSWVVGSWHAREDWFSEGDDMWVAGSPRG